METLDTPLQLKFNNGPIFPPNMVIIAYVVLPLSILALLSSWILGTILFVAALIVAFGRMWVEIDDKQQTVREYNRFVGLITIGKTKSIKDHRYITIMPLIESAQVNASYANSTSISNAYFMIVLFKERLKGKTIVTKFDTKSEAFEVAKKLADRLSMTYFEYDPKLVREILLGNRSIV